MPDVRSLKSLARVTWGLSLLLACQAGPDRKVDIIAPAVMAISPADSVVPGNVTFVVKFSEPIKRSSVFRAATTTDTTGQEFPDGILLVEARNRDKIVKASSTGKTTRVIDSLPLSASERALAVTTDVSFSEDRRELRLAPADALAPVGSYILFLSRQITDDANNRLLERDTAGRDVLETRFVVQPLADTISPKVSLVRPVAGQRGVPLDLSRVELAFSEPVDAASLDLSQFALEEDDGSGRIPALDASWSGDHLVVNLPAYRDELCSDGVVALLCSTRSYRLRAAGLVTDEAGNRSVVDGGQSFTAAACLDTEPPRVGPDVSVEADDITARISWTTDEPSTSEIDILSCDDGDCPRQVTGPAATCDVDICALPDDATRFACRHTVVLTHLSPTSRYTVRIRSVDDGGREAALDVTPFTTLAAQPRLALTELFAAPLGFTDANKAKFVELQNVGQVPVDLTPAGSGKGWALARCSDASCSTLTNRWPMKPTGSSAVLAPGAFAVAAGTAFDVAVMEVPSDTLMLRHDGTATTVLSNGLTSTTAYIYVLINPSGAIVSRYGAHLGKPDGAANKGHSFERIVPSNEDAAENWRLSASPVAGAAGNFASAGRGDSVAR